MDKAASRRQEGRQRDYAPDGLSRVSLHFYQGKLHCFVFVMVRARGGGAGRVGAAERLV